MDFSDHAYDFVILNDFSALVGVVNGGLSGQFFQAKIPYNF